MYKEHFVSATKLGIAMLGLNPSEYTGHSYRAGSATTASMVGFSSWELKMLGRWESGVYSIYLRKPELVASFAKRLI